MKFSQMPYHRPDADALIAAIGNLTTEISQAKTAAEALEIYVRFENVSEEFETLDALCYVRNTINTKDEFYEAEREYFDSVEPLVQDASLAFLRAMFALDCRAELEAELGTTFFVNYELMLKGFSSEIIPLQQEENALNAQYQKLYASAMVDFNGQHLTLPQLAAYKQSSDRDVRRAAYEAEGRFFDEHREEFDEIFAKLVANRTEQAKKLGYPSFVELGYVRRIRNCYNAQDVARFRQQVIDYIVPVVSKIKQNQKTRIGIDGDFMLYDDPYCFPDGNPVPQGSAEQLLEMARQMYTEMSPETAEFISMMYDMELFDVLSRDGKAPGGYCTTIKSYKCPFIFSNFNGTSDDVDVLTHEAGHAFADFISYKGIKYDSLRQPTMEACETHSMSMEFLTAPWHHLFFGDQTDKYELFHAQEALVFIPYGTMVDHFQEECYAHPEMTAQERNELWDRLEKIYRPHLSREGMPFYSRGAGWQKQLHIYLYPFYYIDYCMAQTAALQIWVKSMENRDAAWQAYMKVVSLGGTDTFTGILHQAGLMSPIDDGSLKQITDVVSNWIDQHNI